MQTVRPVAADPFDVVLAGDHLINPAQRIDGPHDVAIRNRRIAAILPRGSAAPTRDRIDVSGRLVIPGMIDTHGHVFQHGPLRARRRPVRRAIRRRDTDQSGRPVLHDALLKVDVGHGSHFSYRMARIALDAGIVPDTLGADMHGYDTDVPAPPGTPSQHSDPEHMFFGRIRFSLASAMTAMLALGLPLEHVVRMVTCNVVDIFGLPRELGTLAVGNPAEVSVLHDDRGRWMLQDNENTKLVGERLLRPDFCLHDGKRFDADASILPEVLAA